MLLWTRSGCWCAFMALSAALGIGNAQGARAASDGNAIRSGAPEESVSAVNGSGSGTFEAGVSRRGQKGTQVYPCTSDKECTVGMYCHCPHQGTPRCLACRKRKKRCHRDAMCCPGNRCNNYICVPISDGGVSPRSPALKGHHKLVTKERSWKNGQSKPPAVKGHEGDPCLRSSDCAEGHCCARHFWTKICKPVLRRGEVCTRQRRKGSHSLELFQRCDCARDLSCKVWRDATSASKSRLHVCQKA
ncbi:dickkopf-related protein 2-like [Scleropages formosus]|uniref:Dickkopf N-terminal cysteine-rich domain-containing protein n=1 Tax=Scleropages formosus TaxID=113540 RepID=A0A8C9SCJ7_SCLFO|nr:dickkopf-related protein 2 [Scleropages formosus]